MNRIRGIDSIRFVCALWVTLSHVGLPPISGSAPEGILRQLDGAARSLINGPAAVIVFFVVSGFCIHYPYRNGGRPYLPSYYARRLLRIGLPFAAAVLISYLLRVGYAPMAETVLWSLVAEIIYYLLYPFLLDFSRRWGWDRLIVLGFVAAVVVTATKPGTGNYPAFGDALNWLVGLPVWMLGCRVAQQSDTLPEQNRINIWLWRGAVFLLSFVAVILRWHFPISIGYPWTLNLFALVVTPWFAQEIRHFRRHAPKQLLESAGTWSYSQYLIHIPVFVALERLALSPGLALARGWLLTPALLFAAYGFYRAVEYPSHLIAVWAGTRLKQQTPTR